MGWIFQSPRNSVSQYQMAPGLLLQIKMVIEDFIKTVSKGKGCLSNTDLVSHTNESARNGMIKDRKGYSHWWQIREDWVKGQKNTRKSPKTIKSQVVVINWQMNVISLALKNQRAVGVGGMAHCLWVPAALTEDLGSVPSTHLVVYNGL